MPETQEKSPPVFRRRITGVAYDAIPPVRAELARFLEDAGTGKEQAGRFLLTLTEILSNLAKHPQRKPAFASIMLETGRDGFRLDIADDGTPFSDFDAQCKAALAKPQASSCLSEEGYGLGCILRQHRHVVYTPAAKSADGLNHFTAADGLVKERPVVFLVDDDPVTLKIQTRMLETHYDVAPFPDAESALAAFPRLRPALVISDLMMPGMDGTELRRALTKLEGGSATPFAFLSSVAEQRNAPYINALGIDDFICKPVAQDHLLAVTARLLKRSEQVRNAVHGRMSAEITALLRPALPPEWNGWRMAVRTVAAETGGGDFILHHETKDALQGILADVMGHGHMAKFFSYTYAGYLRGLFRLMDNPDPAAFLGRLSACAEGDEFLENMIMTCQAFRLMPGGRVSIVSAGHPPPILVKSNSAEDIAVAGPLPGLSGNSHYDAAELALPPGGKILFATDGFFSAFDGPKFHYEELYPLLDGRLGAEALATALWAAFTKKKPTLADDATLVIIEHGE